MRSFKAIAALVLATVPVVACGASPDASESTGTSQEAVKSQPTVACQSDSSCGRGQVCEPICPNIPGRAHCEIVGGTCEPICNLPSSTLSGTTFTSADGTHSITFTSKKAYTKTDGCSNTGIHCNHVVLTTGNYYSNGTTIDLESSAGAFDTLTVESHCYAGLVDNADGVELYPAN